MTNDELPLIFVLHTIFTGCQTSHSNQDATSEKREAIQSEETETASNPDEASEEEIEEEIDDNCAFEIPAHFISIEEREVGLGPEEVVLGHWSIIFKEDAIYEWNYSDITEFGTFSCYENIISHSSYEGMTQSIYDIQTETLLWGDVTYQHDKFLLACTTYY